MDKYDLGTGLIGGLQQGIGSYFAADAARQERMARDKENKAQGLLRAKAEGLIPKYDLDGNIVDYDVDERVLRLKNPQHFMPQLTKGQEAADTAAGKEFQEYQSGGRQDIKQNIGLLGDVAEKLKTNPGLSGGLTTKIPFLSSDIAQKIINPEGISARDQVRSAVQGTIKQLYPGQVTDAEAKRVFELAYDPQLSGEENHKRISSQIALLAAKAKDKDSLMSEFGSKGTISGFRPGGLMPQSAQAAKPLSPEDQQALQWANDPANRNDPRALAIKQKLGQ